jgi:hypothetical protein
MVLAADKKQARVIKQYASGLIQSVPMLASIVVKDTKETIELANGITIEVHAASFRTIRGFTVCAAICEELAFWHTDESANPDTEILNALRPAMATVPGAMLLALSSPYARRGELWKNYKAHFGKDGDVLVWQADTRTMNPAVPQSFIDAAYAEDDAAASAEYGAQFRSDLERFVSREAVEAVTVVGRQVLEPEPGVRYVAFCDPSGGSADSMTLAITHRARSGQAVLDLVVEKRAPFNPESVVDEFAGHLHRYGVRQVGGDHYAGHWPRVRFERHGVEYRVSDDAKSAIYGTLLPLITGGRVELLDQPRLFSQLINLERKTSRVGKDTIDHPPRQHDDVANAAAGALIAATAESRLTIGMARMEQWM